MNKPLQIVGLGEVLWDVFPEGPKFGGAPANFACSVSEITGTKTTGTSAETYMVSAVGKDDLGAGARKALSEHGVHVEHLANSDYPTGRVDVQLDAAGVASYVFAEDVAWDHLEWSPSLALLAAKTDIVCFGTLGQRRADSREVIQQFLWSTPRSALRVFDINLRSPYWNEDVIFESLKLANILKLNDAELPILAKLLSLQGNDRELLESINRIFSLKLSALTRGASGSLLVSASGDFSDLPGEPVKVVDTVGAGDAFTAAMTVGLVHRLPLNTINHWASKVAAYVCSQAGAAPHLPESLKAQPA